MENIEIKTQIFQYLDRLCPKHTILATNTSSLPITAIGATTKRAEKVIGMHFSNPAPVVKLVEIIKGLAKELIYTGDVIDAAEACRIGLVNKVVAPEELMSAAQDMAEKIASRAPLAVQLSKAAINEGINVDLETGVAYEAEVFGLCFATAGPKEGMSVFMEKRKAAFIGK